MKAIRKTTSSCASALFTITIALAAFLTFNETRATAESPAGCNANNVYLNIAVQSPLNGIVTNGQTAVFAVTVGNPYSSGGGAFVSCDATGMTVNYECPGANGQPSGAATTLTNNMSLLTPPFLQDPPNEVFFLNLPCVIDVGTNTLALFRATVTDGVIESVAPSPFSRQSTINLTVVHPSIDVTKQCVSVTNIGGGQVVITYSGTVTNTGDETLVNVFVVNNQPTNNTPVIGPITLAPGAGTNFVRSYTNSVNECGPFPDTLTASGVGQGSGAVVTDTASANCTINYTPGIFVTKNCDTVVLGQGNTVSGVVSNTGNITLTNISIVDNIYGTLASGITLAPGTFTNYSRLATNNTCGNFTNIVTAIGSSICGGSVTNRATNVCITVATPAITVTKNCDTVILGHANTVSGVVSNSGTVTLTSVNITDDLYGTLASGITLIPGASTNYSRQVTNNACGVFTNIVTATGNSACGSATNTAGSFCVVQCPLPCVGITKEIACYLGDDNCGVFGQTATGVKGDSQDPAFCYRITITNCGISTLTNVTVIDNQFGDLTTNFFGVTSGTLGVGQSITYEYKAELDQNVTNTATVTGQSAVTGQTVSTNATAIATVIPASITCQKIAFSTADLDGNANNNSVELPGDGNSYLVTWGVVVINNGQANLINVVISDPGCGGTNILIPSLEPGQAITNILCEVSLTCSNLPLTNSVFVSANVDPGTNNLCALDMAGTNITVTSQCSASVTGACEPKRCCVFLLIDEDCIDNTTPGYSLPPNTGKKTDFEARGRTFTAQNVNDDVPRLAQRMPLRFFNNPTNFGRVIILRTGQVGDEGMFAMKEYPHSWNTAGPTANGLRNFVGDPCVPFPHNVGPGLGTGSDPEKLLDKIPRVTPLRATALSMLIGSTVCALVWDSDISINYDPLNGSLKGEKLGVVAFKVLEVKQALGFSSSSLPLITIEIVDPCSVFNECIPELFLDAPEPRTSSEPVDIVPPSAPPRLVPVRVHEDGNCRISCDTEAGKNYTLEYTDTLSAPNWNVLSNFVGTGSIVIIPDLNGPEHRFYRMKVE